MTYEEELKLSYDLFDTLPFDEPEDGIDLAEYISNAEYKFESIELPDIFDGEVFNFVTEYEIGQYLEKRFNVRIRERCQYVIQKRN